MPIYTKGDIVIFEDDTNATLPGNIFLTIGNFYLGKKIKNVKSPFIENGEQPINSEPKQEAYSGRAPKERESEWDKSIPLENRKPGWGYSNPNISTVPGNDPRAGGGVNADALRNPNAASVGKRIVGGGNLGNNYAYNYLKTISLDSL